MAGGFVADEDRGVACVERVSDSLGEILIKLIDAGYVSCTRSEVEENLAFVVRRGLVATFYSRHETTPGEHMNSNEHGNEKERDDKVCAAPEAVEKPQPANCENNQVQRDE